MKTEITFRRLRTASAAAEESGRQMDQGRSDLEDIARSLRQTGDQELIQLAARLDGKVEELASLSQRMKTMGQVLEKVLGLYEETEEAVIDLLEFGQWTRKPVRVPKSNDLDLYRKALRKMDLRFKI